MYAHVVGDAEPVTREAANAATGLDRSLVAYHLDRLANEGLLASRSPGPPGGALPGAGRPVKYCTRADVEIAVSVLPRDYHLAAEILVRAVDEDSSGTLRTALEDVARRSDKSRAPATTPATSSRPYSGRATSRTSTGT